MGAKLSVPQRIYQAARNNDLAELQRLVQDMALNASLDAAGRHALLNWTDEEGRTALMWAAQRNFLHVAQLLLEQGADVHAIAPKRRDGGSALAEAVVAKHEALVDLLLRHGADPFTENPAGKTPLDLALEARSPNILRACERHALFAGYVNTKVLQLKGFSTANKDRWVVVAPRFTPPARGSSVGVVRVMLLMYRNAAEAEPRTKVWLDGSTLYRTGGEAVLRLHSNHVQPRNCFTRYDGGWLLFFKPAAHSAHAAATLAGGASSPASPDACYAAFLAIAARPLEQLQQQQQQAALRLAAASAAANPWQQPGAPAPAPGWSSAGGSGSPYAASGGGGGGGSSGGGGGYAALQHAGLHVQPAYAPPSAAQQPGGQQQQQQHYPEGTELAARPGESDEDFARRLASIFGSSSPSSSAGGGGGSWAPSPGSTAPPSRLASSSAQRSQPQPQPPSPPQPAPASSLPAASDNPFLAHSEPAGGAPGGAGAAAPAAPPPAAAAAAAAPAMASAPSAPSLAGSSDAADGGASDAELCVICLSNAREVGLLHGSSVHKCLCRDCAGLVRVGAPCPLCRQTVERVLGVY